MLALPHASPPLQTLRLIVAQESTKPFVTLEYSASQCKTTAVSVAFYFLTIRGINIENVESASC